MCPDTAPDTVPERAGAPVPPAGPAPAAPRGRLSRETWVQAGFAALLAEGPAGLRVEAIARDLGTTKGSFYWHFRDAPDLRSALLADWETRSTAAFEAALGASALAARRRIMRLVDAVAGDESGGAAGGGAAMPGDAALRDWARTDPEARAALDRVDGARLAALRGVLLAAGLGGSAAGRGAATLLAALVGFAALQRSTGADVRRDLAALARAVLEARI